MPAHITFTRKSANGSTNQAKSEALERFLDRTQHFLIDAICIRDLFQSVVPILKTQDEARRKQLVDMLKSLKRPQVKKNTLSFSATFREAKIINESFSKLHRANAIFHSSSITGLVTSFDLFFADVLKAVLQRRPEKMNSSQRAVLFKDAARLKSLEELRSSFVDQELDEVMRGSHEDQFRYLEKLLDFEICSNYERWADFVEVTERRNLHVHTADLSPVSTCEYASSITTSSPLTSRSAHTYRSLQNTCSMHSK